ncbi:DNA mismatch repair protein msh6, partial [Spiromyces aspiralis]
MHMLGEQDEVKQAKRLNFLVWSYPAELPALLDKFRHGFDRKLAETEGTIIPTPGLDEEYDQAREAVAEIEQWLDGHLKEHQKRYHCPSLTYKHIGKEHYQLEFPLSVQPPDNYVRLSATKKVHRYWSPELIKKVRAHAEALETETMALRRVQSRIYALFDRSYSTWMKAIQIAAEVDALRSLAYASVSMGAPYCRPIFVDPDAHGSDGDGAGPVGRAGGYLEFRELRHPCVALAASQGSRDFVPNDVVLGTRPQDLERPAGVDFGGGEEDNDGATMILLTGPNMGGKSTLLRQVCLGIILAQLGCYVPASYAALTPVDRLFTRLGARDHLLSGQSTFMVELAETSTLLHHATPRSFVAVDELGRGTSTHDGEAVAYGVLHSISSRLGCLGIFSTHYGMLADGLGCVEHGTSPVAGATAGAPSPQEEDSVEQGILPNAKMSVEPHVRPMHMACAVDDDARRVTFLYKLNRGIAPRSHGMNVAAMAGVPLDVVKRAEVVAEKFEHGVKARIESRRAQKQQAVALDQSRQMPLTLQSDFANLLRLAKMTHAKADSSAAEFVSRQNPALLDRVGGVNALAEFNENQYWGCV